MVTIIIDFFRRRIAARRQRKAFALAQHLADLHRRKYLVLLWRGHPEVISMQGVKKLIREKKLILSADKARQIALFEANPRKSSAQCS